MIYPQSAGFNRVRRTLLGCMGAAAALASAACGRDWSYGGEGDGGSAAGTTSSSSNSSSSSSSSSTGGGGGQSPDGGPPGCDPGQTRCGADCVDLQADAKHCGACAHACAPGGSCQAGVCQCFAGTVEQINPTLPQDIFQSTVGTTDVYAASCGGAGAGDRIYQLTAPVDGAYSFEITQSEHDPVLTVLDADTCTELACDVAGSSSGAMQGARASLDLTTGKSVYVVVSDVAGVQGSFGLSVGQRRLSDCTPVPLEGAVPVSAVGNTSSQGDSGTPTCVTGDMPGPDAVYQFTAPADGSYLFDTSGSSFATVLEVLGDGCGGPSLGCDRAQNGFQPSISVPLLAGQAVVLRVDGLDGASGNYRVNVDVEPSRCANVPLAGPLPLVVTGDTFGRGDSLTPSCGSSNPGADIDYTYTVPADGRYEITLDTVDYDTVLAIHAGDCEAREIACNDDEPDTSRSAVTVDLVAGQVINIAVDSYYSREHGQFTLTIRDL